MGGGPRKRAFRRATALPTERRCCPRPCRYVAIRPRRGSFLPARLLWDRGGGPRRGEVYASNRAAAREERRATRRSGSRQPPPAPAWVPVPIFRKGLPAHSATSPRVACAEQEVRKAIGADGL